MAFSVVMPALEMAQTTGKLLAWRKREGDRVAKGEPLLEIETDKAVVEIEAPADGLLSGICAMEGAEIPVGQTIAWIVQAGENAPTQDFSTSPVARAGMPAKTELMPSSSPKVQTGASQPGAKISPKARRLAKEVGLDINLLQGSGPGGEIQTRDIESAARAHASSELPSHSGAIGKSGKLEVLTSLGRIMAERTTQSWTTVPHFFITRDVDADSMNRYRDRILAEHDGVDHLRITHTDIFVALAARVLLKHPRLNASWTAEGIRLHNYVNMGLAVSVSDGVVAVVIREAHNATPAEISVSRHDLSERARAGKLRPADIADATFTISNLGMYKVDQFNAIITPPQAAVLAVGTIADRVVAIEGKPTVRSMTTLTACCDHRVVDGARAAMFLTDLAQALSDPDVLLA